LHRPAGQGSSPADEPGHLTIGNFKFEISGAQSLRLAGSRGCVDRKNDLHTPPALRAVNTRRATFADGVQKILKLPLMTNE
jgi:hypothetical protein